MHVSAHHKLIGVATDPNATINLRPRELAGLESAAELPLSDIQEHVLIEVLAPAQDPADNSRSNLDDQPPKVLLLLNMELKVPFTLPSGSQGDANKRKNCVVSF